MAFETQYLESAGIQLIHGDRGTNYPKQEHFKATGHCLFLSAKNVTLSGFAFGERVFIDGDRDALLRAGKLQRGDVVLTTRGTIGNVAFYGHDIPFDHVRINSGMMILRANPALWNSRFLYFLFASSYVQEQISALTTGSAVPQLPARDLKKFRLPVIKKEIQNFIDKIVGEISQKITLNRRINQTLEAMAQAIFKSWFVDFDPVKAKIAAIQEGRDPLRAAMSAISGKSESELDALPPEEYEQLAATAALFPDEMEESELGEIPRGWTPAGLSEIAEVVMGQSPDGESYNDSGNGMALINGPVEFDSYHPKQIKWTTLPSKTSHVGDLIVCVRGSTTGKFVKSDGIYCLGRGVCAIRAKEQRWQPFVDQTYKFSLTALLSLATGSTFPSWSGPTLKNHRILRPASDLIAAFSILLQPIISQISTNEAKIKSLAELRDTLLPKLLSGELPVTEVDSNPSEVSP